MRRLPHFVLFLVLFSFPLISEEHGGAAEHKSEGGHSQSSEVWKWANFGILAALIVWAIAKNAPPFFESRTAAIQKSIVEARKIREQADAKAAEIDRKLANLTSEIDAMRTQAKREMDAEAQRIQDETTKTLARLEEQSRIEIEWATKHAENELQAYAAQLAVDLAKQKIQTRIDAAAQNVLVDKFVASLPGKGQES